jgi:hypothetical protein
MINCHFRTITKLEPKTKNENRNKRALVVGTRDIYFPISGYTKFGEFFPKIAKSV